MPHLMFECSSKEMVPEFFQERVMQLHRYLAATLPTDIKNCKSRLYIANQACLGEEASHPFMHVTLKILPGRDEALLAEIGQWLLTQMQAFLKEDQKPYEQVSIEIAALSPHYFKPKA